MNQTHASANNAATIELVLPELRIEDHATQTPFGRMVVPGHNIPEKRIAVDAAQVKQLMTSAREATKKGYAPFSKFHVGAAVIMADDPEQKIYTGANSENSCLNCGCCAERSAIFAAVSNGFRRIRYVAVSCANALDLPLNERSPCGECRQAIKEFTDHDAVNAETLIFVDNGDDDTLCEVLDIERLLPYSFKLNAAE